MIEFEERAVAFIDILGFKWLVNQAATSEDSLLRLSRLVELLEGAVPRLDAMVDPEVPSHLIPKHNCISDCIIISAPLKDHIRRGYSGLDILIMRVIQLTHFFLDAGYLLRGGISVGKVWHTDSNIVGPAYQEAYLLETKADKPIVLLSEEAARYPRWGSRMCIEDGGKVFVNGLHDYYINGNMRYGVVEETYKKYENLADCALRSEISSSAKEKWSWFKEYLSIESREGLGWASAYSDDQKDV